MSRIRLVKSNVMYRHTESNSVASGDLVYDLESRIYMMVFNFEDGNIHGALNLVDQVWAKEIDLSELDKRAQT